MGIRLVWRVCNALTSGALAEELPERVDITTRQKLKVAPGAVTRTLDHFGFRGGPALALLDFDPKGVPFEIPNFLTTITNVMPVLANAPRVTRASTSAGLFRADTGQKLPGGDGRHVYIAVEDGRDIEWFITDLHQWSWLAGYG